MDAPASRTIDILLAEYEALKSEQQARIAFRDNLLYATLGASGGIVAFALSKDGPNAALLAIPWLTLILGWTYLVNDEKISASGRYIRAVLEPELQRLNGSPAPLFAWESAHRSDDYRRERKFIQLFIDLLTFAGSGVAAIALCLARETAPAPALYWIGAIGLVLMAFLAFEIVTYFDWGSGS